MNTAEFKSTLKPHIRFSDKIGPHDIPWEYWYKLAVLTEHINFDCKFNFTGICKRYQGELHRKSGRRSCCDSCRSAKGFFNILPDQVDILDLIASYFDKEYGFWRSGVGCILPRKYRSAVCLAAHCTMDLTHSEKLLMGIIDGIRVRYIIENHGVTAFDTLLGVIKEGMGITPEPWEI